MKKITFEEASETLYRLLGKGKSNTNRATFFSAGYNTAVDVAKKKITKLKKKIKQLEKVEKNPNEQEVNSWPYGSLSLETSHKKVEEIMADVNDTIDLDKFIADSSIGISNKIKFYIHMDALFLNVLLNRIFEFGEKGEQKALLCKKIISKIIEKLQEN